MYKVLSAIFIVTIFSCNTNNLNNGKWQILDAARGISYSVREEGGGIKGDLAIKYFGSLVSDELVQDTARESQSALAEIIKPVIAEENKIKQLPIGTTGFIKVNAEVFFQQNYSEIIHYTLFFNGKTTDKELQEDSVKLGVLGVFKKIDIINHEKAMSKFESDNDTTWRSFIKSNPLPASIELTLKREFIAGEKYDSIKNILASSIVFNEMQLPSKGLLVLNGGLKQELVYKFVIF